MSFALQQLAILILVYAILVSIPSVQSVSSSSPNVVMFVVDDLGWSDVGYHNITSIKTPNIDQLAYDGVILQNYYVQPICTPTRSALMSGKYPIHTGMQKGVIRPTDPHGLPLDLELLPQTLKKAGYSTHIVGKWHLGYFQWEYTPTYRGFDTFYGFYLGSGDHWTHKRLGILDFRDQKKVVNPGRVYSSELFSKRAVKIISDHDSTKPMFLYLPFQNVHSPNQAPEKYVKDYQFITDDNRRYYAGMMAAVDDAVAQVTNALKKKRMWDNTLIIFTTDNGGTPKYGGFNWPLRGSKGTLWEGGVRGAGFVHGGMIQKKQRICNEMIHVTDWYPTIASLAGAEVPSKLDGHNVWDTISQASPSPRTEILLNIQAEKISKGPAAIRVGDMKLLMNVKNDGWSKPPEMEVTETGQDAALSGETSKKKKSKKIKIALYNIATDPNEENDLSKDHPEVVWKLKKKLREYQKGIVAPSNPGPDPKALELAKKNKYWGPWVASESR